MTQLTDTPTLCFETEVVRVRRLSPSFTRITFGGECLSRFDACGDLGPRDLRIKVLVPVGDVPPAFVRTDRPDWYQTWLRGDPEQRGEMRTYTVRAVRHDGGRPEVDVDFVLHDHDGHSGPAASWARSASVGDRMLLLGPNGAGDRPYGGIEWQPPHPAGRVLLAGDETAAPAIASILSTLPASYSGHAIVEVGSAEDFVALASPADVEVTWLARASRARGRLLLDAVRDAVPPRRDSRPVAVPDVDPDLLWETPPDQEAAPDTGSPYVWIAGEAEMVKGLRRYLVGEAGLPRSTVAFMGYWREGGTV